MKTQITYQERAEMKAGETFVKVWLLEFFDEEGRSMLVPTKKVIGRYHSKKDALNAIWNYRFDVLEGADGDFQIGFYEVKRERSEKDPAILKAKCYETYMV